MSVLRIPRVILTGLCLTACAFSQAADPPSEEQPAEAKLSPLDELLSERGTAAEFAKAVTAAEKAGVSAQAILEARFLYLVDRQDDAGLIALLPSLLEKKDTFDPAASAIFAVREDWLAVTEYVQALAALKKGDKAGFKKHITEAFWLSPRQGSAFAPHIDRMRTAEAMQSVKLDPSMEVELLADGKKATLSSLATESKGTLLHFWSPWSSESADSMTDFIATAPEMVKGKLTVISVLAEAAEGIDKDAKEVLGTLGDKLPGIWIKGESSAALAKMFRVQSLPVMVLVSPEGTVLYNGEPSGDAFWTALEKISPGLKRPRLPEN